MGSFKTNFVYLQVYLQIYTSYKTFPSPNIKVQATDPAIPAGKRGGRSHVTTITNVNTGTPRPQGRLKEMSNVQSSDVQTPIVTYTHALAWKL